ncbi:MAG: entericidin [Sphingobacteriales bacterium]|nr:entericidin [Sphingobacteriales bacterium]
MKKALLAFAIVAFVACNNETKPAETKDTTAAPAVVDSAVKAVVDTAAKKVDSTVKAVVDSATKKK